MLKGIPSILSPELMQILMSMGHGDEIVLADGNFPASTVAQRLVRADGHGVPEILAAVVKFFPLDTYADDNAVVMQVVAGDPVDPVIWREYQRILAEAEGRAIPLTEIDRFEFYNRARKAYAVVATGEGALYANLILKKGVVVE